MGISVAYRHPDMRLVPIFFILGVEVADCVFRDPIVLARFKGISLFDKNGHAYVSLHPGVMVADNGAA